MAIVRGTTPTFTLTFPDTVDLTEADNVYVTFTSGDIVMTKTGTDLDVTAHEISVYLTQEETFSFGIGNIEIQANWTVNNGNRIASEIKNYAISRQLLNEVIS